MKNIRLDLFLVEHGLSQSREKAKKEIISGWVKVNGETLRDPSKKITGNEKIIIERPGGLFVSRGGDKLQHALHEFHIDLTGMVALDLGASTGGFTDCMLKSGAVKVYAVDVGYNQLDYSLRIDQRVVVMEKTHARDIKREMFPERIDFFTADLSFISILKVLPAVYDIFDNIHGVILVKPQFEAESSQHKKGVVRNPEDHVEILQRVAAGIVETGFNILKITYSPIKGPAGNIEFLFFIFKGELSGYENYKENQLESEISTIVETAHNTLQ
ncbi:MAG: TlyA family rRNA (cytidine-2'-O)-methyltransferase [Spirochaetae bacterium HGW-Spirochaetae-5]|nr:MAG: TlyA family rRNA (cytidine-2'-O)-methyltransferase [Spirochaetae bacterium HGW-Spirochaetae-5]